MDEEDEEEGGNFEDFPPDTAENPQSFDPNGESRSTKNNAALTGFDRALKRRGLMSGEGWELRSMLKDERYFIVLMAYDWQKLRTEKKQELIWTIRFSLDAIGTTFREAHHALSRGAANYIGTNLDGKLKGTKTHLGPGDVELGDIKVVETVEEDSAK